MKWIMVLILPYGETGSNEPYVVAYKDIPFSSQESCEAAIVQISQGSTNFLKTKDGHLIAMMEQDVSSGWAQCLNVE